jgi:hypothetical protein
LPPGQSQDIFDLIGELIRAFNSPDIAIDERHTPKLYARFLGSLVSRHRRDGATSGRLHTAPPPQSRVPFTAKGNNSSNVPPLSTSMTSAFSMQPPSVNGSGSGNAGSHDSTSMGSNSDGQQVTPIYQPDTRYLSGMGPIDFGGGDADATLVDDDVPPMMNQLKDSAWWQTMMMPG